MKKVSIIVPVYNVEKYISECLNSLIKQTYSNIEIILVNDGSTDKSGEICKKYAGQDKRIKVIEQENQGAANAKNNGLEHVTGDYITFIDSDDYVELHWIKTMVDTLEDKNADVVECNFVKEYVDSYELGNDNTYAYKEFSSETYMEQYLSNWTCSLFWNKLFKVEITENVYFRRERRCIDDEFYTYKILSNAKKIVRIEDILYHYRQRISSAVVSEKNRIQKTDDALEVLIERYEWIKNKFPRLTKIYLRHDIDIMFYFAREFVFCDNTIKKFYKVAKYYSKECFKHYPGKVTMKNMVILLLIKKSELLTCKKDDCYFERKSYFL